MVAHFEVQDLSFAYPTDREHKVLDQVSCRIRQGSYTVICGTSGSGKTTLLRHFKSVLTPHGVRSGQILFEGRELSQTDAAAQAEKIGFVMQNPDEQLVTDKVWHELAFGLENLGCRQETMRSRVAEMASYFGIQDWFHRDVSDLSGGQKQLLNLASVMAMQPDVLILDEPTSQLDPTAATDFLSTIRRINLDLGITVIITEHRLEEILPCADQVIVMEEGRVIADDDPRRIADILWKGRSSMFAALPTAMRVSYCTGQTGESLLTVREGRTWLQSEFSDGVRVPMLTQQETPDRQDDPALEMKDVWFRYEKNGADILRGLQMRLPKGKICTIVGGNGAGKSTALKVLCGIRRPYRGKVKIFGKDIRKYEPGSLFQGCLAMLPQDPKSLFVKKTVREELQEMTTEREKMDEVIRLCRLEGLLERHPYDLSGGEQQRTAIAKVLLTDPKLLLLDEPTKGLDNEWKHTLAGIFSCLKEKGVTVVVVTHDVEFSAKYADSVSFLFDGQILTTDTPASFYGGNSFYTTAASRMSRNVFVNAVTAEDVVALYHLNKNEERE